jgi:hypothetical protein
MNGVIHLWTGQEKNITKKEEYWIVRKTTDQVFILDKQPVEWLIK